MPTNEKPIVAVKTCSGPLGCGSKIPLRKDARGRLYYSCSGELEGNGCGARGTAGLGPSRDFLKGVAAEQGTLKSTGVKSDDGKSDDGKSGGGFLGIG